MEKWKEVVVAPDTSIGETIRCIEATAMQIALVVDANGCLVGAVTDGDIRRVLIQGMSIESSICNAMNPAPRTLGTGVSPEEALNYMRRHSIHHVPLTDTEGRLTGVYFIDELIGVIKRPNTVVLMAGGVGARLRPLTDACPKPLLPVGGRPILERILERFVEQGFQHFYISVNYKAEMIIEHFGNGERWGVHIDYLTESERLGTAGALSLISEKPNYPLIVMNGDLLTEVDFVAMLHEHQARNAQATMAVREYEMQIPYGVVKVEDGLIQALQEKPSHKFLVNAGIYVLEPQALDHLSKAGYADMPTLFEQIRNTGITLAYPLREYWVDIGRLEDLEAVQFALQTQSTIL